MTLKHLLVATALAAGMLTLGTVLSEPPELPALDQEQARAALPPGGPAEVSAAVSAGKDVNGTAQAAPNAQAAPRKLHAHSAARRWVFPHGPKY